MGLVCPVFQEVFTQYDKISDVRNYRKLGPPKKYHKKPAISFLYIKIKTML